MSAMRVEFEELQGKVFRFGSIAGGAARVAVTVTISGHCQVTKSLLSEVERM